MMISFIAWSSQPLTTAGMMEPAIDWASWRAQATRRISPKHAQNSHETHDIHMSECKSLCWRNKNSWFHSSNFPKKTIPKHLLEFSWDFHHQKTPNVSQFPTTSSIGPNVTTSQCLRFPTTLNRMRKKRDGSHGNTMEIAWNTCWFSGLLGDSQEQFHNPILGYTILYFY